jgi:hypothetical protein
MATANPTLRVRSRDRLFVGIGNKRGPQSSARPCAGRGPDGAGSARGVHKLGLDGLVPGFAAASRICTPRAHPASGSRDSTAESRPPRRRSRNDVRRSARNRGVEARPRTPTIGGDDRTRLQRLPHASLVFSYDNKGSRTHPAGRRRKLPPVPANPRNRRVEKARSWWESPPIPAQPGYAMTGRHAGGRGFGVPSLPCLKAPAKQPGSVVYSGEADAFGGPIMARCLLRKNPANDDFAKELVSQPHEQERFMPLAKLG